MKDIPFLSSAIRTKKSFLCVGLDPDLKKLPESYLKYNYPLLQFCKDAVESTKDFAIAYKINIAFFEAAGPKGWLQLEKLVESIPSQYFIIADAKRGDIGNTSSQYAQYFFNTLAVDALTLNPYMGVDSAQPFLDFKNHWSIILALTSNPGSKDFECIQSVDQLNIYEHVIKTFSNLNLMNQIMFVVGATHPEKLAEIRKLCQNHFFLIPGIGSQGGDLDKVIASGRNVDEGLLINIGRSILYPEDNSGLDHQLKMNYAAKTFQNQMSKYFN